MFWLVKKGPGALKSKLAHLDAGVQSTGTDPLLLMDGNAIPNKLHSNHHSKIFPTSTFILFTMKITAGTYKAIIAFAFFFLRCSSKTNMLFLHCPLVSTSCVLSHSVLGQEGSLSVMRSMTHWDISNYAGCRWLKGGFNSRTTTRCHHCFQMGCVAKQATVVKAH